MLPADRAYAESAGLLYTPVDLLPCAYRCQPTWQLTERAFFQACTLSRAMCSRHVLSVAALRPDPSAHCVQEAANKSLCSLSEESKVSAERLLQTDTLAKIKQQLDGTDPAVKQTGLATVASLASASAELADAVVDEPLLDAIAQLLRAPELPPDLHTAACQALANAASHTLELAERIRASGTCSSRILADPGLHEPALCLAAVHDLPGSCVRQAN